jgi:hypothetical protein
MNHQRLGLAPLAVLCVWMAVTVPVAPAASPKVTKAGDALRVVTPYQEMKWSLKQPAFLSLAIDSLGGGKVGANALRSPAVGRGDYEARPAGSAGIEYRRVTSSRKTEPGWRFEANERMLRLVTKWSAEEKPEPLVFEFDPRLNHATLLGNLNGDGTVNLPAVLHLPDQGSYRVSVVGGGTGIVLGYDARRAGTGYVKISFPAATAARPLIEYRWEVVALYPKLTKGEQDARFNGFRKNWLNIFQLNPRLRVLANHAGSDTCAFCLYEYADIARYTPPLAEGVTALDMVRQSLDRYLDGLPGYGMPGWIAFDVDQSQPSRDPPCLDAYPSLLIAAADYVSGAEDTAWLEKRYGGLKLWVDKLLAMDHDGNGLFEYPYSGNSNSWVDPAGKRPANWWDTIGFGHEDAYANALAYRALRGMEMLATRLEFKEDAARYQTAARKLRDAYFVTFYNPASGLLAGWKSADGQLHDYAFMFVNGAAVHYGLVPRDNADAIMDRLLAKMKAVGFTRFELGLPGNLTPVARKDYTLLDRRWGGGEKADNSDGFQIYENGGATACFAYFTLAALYDLGRTEDADRILMPLLGAFERGGFQGQGTNGMSNDWKAWDATPWGYEGLLVDNYYALLAVLTREHTERTGIAYGVK